MIGFLSGIIQAKTGQTLIINVSGVGYQVWVPIWIYQNSNLNDPAEFLIYTHVREDEISLYGFNQPTDKDIFINLISVSGIGPKIALNILSQAKGSQRIIKAIQAADVDYFTQIKGLGKKGAQRIIVDLKTKLGSLKDLEFETEQDQDLLEALKGLGFSPQEIKKAVKDIKPKLPLETKVKLALKHVQTN